MYVYTLHNLQPVYMFFTVASTSPMRQLPGKEHYSSSTHTDRFSFVQNVVFKLARMHNPNTRCVSVATDIAYGAAWEQGHWCHAGVPERAAGPVGPLC